MYEEYKLEEKKIGSGGIYTWNVNETKNTAQYF